jgi:hypothetical protein
MGFDDLFVVSGDLAEPDQAAAVRAVAKVTFESTPRWNNRVMDLAGSFGAGDTLAKMRRLAGILTPEEKLAEVFAEALRPSVVGQLVLNTLNNRIARVVEFGLGPHKKVRIEYVNWRTRANGKIRSTVEMDRLQIVEDK